MRLWEEKGEKRQLVLQENDTGDILVCPFVILPLLSLKFSELRNLKALLCSAKKVHIEIAVISVGYV